MESFASLVQWHIGHGKRTLFWKDRWIRGYRIEEIAPQVASRVRTQVANRRSVHEGLASHAWTNDIVGGMDTDGLAQFIKLWEVLMEVHLTQTLRINQFGHGQNKESILLYRCTRCFVKGGSDSSCLLPSGRMVRH